MSEDRQRIDKWLWHARVVRTRSAAAALVTAGHVRINGQRSDAPSRAVRIGDVVTVGLDRTVRLMRVTGFAERRGDADAARAIYADLAAQPHPDGTAASADPPGQGGPPEGPERDPGTGRPTKRDRRALERLRRLDD